MPKPVVDPIQVAQRPPEMSDYPDKISDTTVAFAMCRAVPDVVDEVTDSAKLVIKHGSLVLENGMTLTPDMTADEPEVEVEGSGTYTLMLIDPDAPSAKHPSLRSLVHMLVINIPANDVPRGELAWEYIPPSPSGRGKHRYIWLLFKQSGRVTMRLPKSREGFQVRDWAKSHNAECASGLWFYAQNEEE